MQQPYPILEFDPAPEAFLEPSRIIAPADVPEHCVVCFFQDVISDVCREAKVAAMLRSEIGPLPVYELAVEGRRLAVFHPGVGAPLAAAFLEEVIALGCRKFIVCGGCGVLQQEIAVGHLLVPTSAVRDEGTSYHYLPAGREVAPDATAVAAIKQTLEEAGIDYVLTKTWTTDAIYRETAAKIALRRAEGCVAVEMEAAALFAVAQFRGVQLAQILYAGDDLSGQAWDGRGWTGHAIRERLFTLSAQACLRL